jgi:hypothetical protein
VNREGVEAFVRERGAGVQWKVLPGASRDIKRLTRFLRALTRELEHAEATEGTVRG